MRPAALATVAFGATVIACTTEPVSPTAVRAVPPSFAAAGGGGTALYKLSLDRDLDTLTTGAGQVVQTSLSTKSPFNNLSLKGVRLTIGTPIVGADSTTTYAPPSGDTLLCPHKSTVPYVTTWDGAQGVWVGDLAADGTSYVKFNGARPGNPAETVQFTVNVGTRQYKDTNGAWHLEYTNAPLVFGGTTTHADLDHRRCVTFALVATP